MNFLLTISRDLLHPLLGIFSFYKICDTQFHSFPAFDYKSSTSTWNFTIYYFLPCFLWVITSPQKQPSSLFLHGSREQHKQHACFKALGSHGNLASCVNIFGSGDHVCVDSWKDGFNVFFQVENNIRTSCFELTEIERLIRRYFKIKTVRWGTLYDSTYVIIF